MKIIALLTLFGATCFAGQLTSTTAEVQESVDNSRGLWTMGDYVFTNALTSTYAIVVPADGFDYSHAGSSDITLDTDAGTFTCNFTGKVVVEIVASFQVLSPGGTVQFHSDVFVDSTDTDFGFQRTMASDSYGSAAATHPALSVTPTDVISVKAKFESASKSIVIHSYTVTIRRIE